MVTATRQSTISSSIVLVRHQPLTHNIGNQSFLDYEILFLKRAPDTFVGGFYAFPGGKVETQDYKDTWLEKVPEIFEEPYRFDLYHDFNKRMAVIRELFEECNLLLVENRHIGGSSVRQEKFPTLNSLSTEFSDDFAGYCKAHRVVPMLEKLYAFRRIGTPYGFPINQDTQFYFYICTEESDT